MAEPDPEKRNENFPDPFLRGTKDPTGDIFQKIIFLNKMMMDNRNNDVEYLGLTCRQADVLFYLFSRKGERINQVKIEQDFHLSNPTITGILNRLEAKGFIRRVISPEDKRCRYIEVTETSQFLDNEITERRSCMEHKMLEGIEETQLEAFQQTLDIMYRNMIRMKEEFEKERKGAEGYD